MKYTIITWLALLSSSAWGQSGQQASGQKQFVLFDELFTYTKADADNSTPSKSHYYVTGDKLNPARPTDWTSPVDYRNGTVHVRLEVFEKPKIEMKNLCGKFFPMTG